MVKGTIKIFDGRAAKSATTGAGTVFAGLNHARKVAIWAYGSYYASAAVLSAEIYGAILPSGGSVDTQLAGSLTLPSGNANTKRRFKDFGGSFDAYPYITAKVKNGGSGSAALAKVIVVAQHD